MSLKRKSTAIDVDRLGSWYDTSKARKVTPINRVTEIMAKRSGVTGAEARDTYMQKTLSKAPKVGNRLFGSGVKVKRQRKRRGGTVSFRDSLNDSGRKYYDEAIDRNGNNIRNGYTLRDMLNGATYGSYLHSAKENNITPTDEGYRTFKVGKLAEFDKRVNDYNNNGIFGNIVDAWKAAAPQAIADAANIVGRVLPAASKVTDQIEDRLSTGKHSWEELGGPVEKLINGATTVAGKAAGGKIDRVLRRLGGYDKISNDRGKGVIYPIPDMKMNPDLAKVFAMASGSSPLDKTVKETVSNLSKAHSNLIKNYTKSRKLSGLNPRRKITKGGRTFTSLRNILVTPEAAP